jgi:hypothetical protein
VTTPRRLAVLLAGTVAAVMLVAVGPGGDAGAIPGFPNGIPGLHPRNFVDGKDGADGASSRRSSSVQGDNFPINGKHLSGADIRTRRQALARAQRILDALP